MADELEVLRIRHPDIAAFLDNWRKKYEKRNFDLKDPTDQADFYEAIVEVAKHVAHTSQKASLRSLISVEGLSLLYVDVTPSH